MLVRQRSRRRSEQYDEYHKRQECPARRGLERIGGDEAEQEIDGAWEFSCDVFSGWELCGDWGDRQSQLHRDDADDDGHERRGPKHQKGRAPHFSELLGIAQRGDTCEDGRGDQGNHNHAEQVHKCSAEGCDSLGQGQQRLRAGYCGKQPKDEAGNQSEGNRNLNVHVTLGI